MGLVEGTALLGLAVALLPLLLSGALRRERRRARFPSIELVEASGAASADVLSGRLPIYLRIAAACFASVAVARPYLGPRRPAERPLRDGGVVVLVDRSLGPMPAEGLGRLRERRQRFGGRLMFLPFDELPGPVLEGDEAVRLLGSELRAGRGRDVEAAARAGARLLNDLPGPGPRTLALLSGVSPEGGLPDTAASQGLHFVTMICPGAEAPSEGAKIASARFSGHGISALVRTGEGWRGGRARVLIEGAEGAACELVVPASRGQVLREMEFDLPGPLPRGALAGVEVLAGRGQELAAFRYLTLGGREPKTRVLLLGGGEAALPVRRALLALQSGGFGLEVAAAKENDLSASGAWDVVVLSGPAESAAGTRELLEKFVSCGGGLVAFLGGPITSLGRRQASFASARNDELLARLLGVRWTGGGGPAEAEFPAGSRFTVGTHQKLAGLRPPERAAAREGAGLARGTWNVVASFSTGDPAVVEREVSLGGAVLFAASPARLAERPSRFLPALAALVERAQSLRTRAMALEADELPARLGEMGGQVELRTPGGETEVLEEGAGTAVPWRGPGLYELRGERARWLLGVNGRGGPAESRRLSHCAAATARGAAPVSDGAGLITAACEELAGKLEGRGAVELSAAAWVLATFALIALFAAEGLLRRMYARRRAG